MRMFIVAIFLVVDATSLTPTGYRGILRALPLRLDRHPSLCAPPPPEGNSALFAAVAGSTPDTSVDLLREVAAENDALRARVRELEALQANTEGLCEVLDDGGGWTSSLRSRATWLLGLLVAQSCSSFVLADNEQLLVTHPTVIFFMTMLVGAGGNAGNQAAVRIIRGLATGEVAPNLSERTTTIITDEVRRAFALGAILVAAGFVRVIAFGYPIESAVAIACSLCSIVFISVVTGAALPMAMDRFGIDPAHAGATIQVIMDLVGVLVTCLICQLILGDPSDHTAPLPVAHPSNALHAAAISSEVQPHQDLSS